MADSSSGRTVVVGIGGITCGGKTTLTAKLRNVFPSVKEVNMDAYYYDEDSPHHTLMKELDHFNWELPSSVDLDRMTKNIKSWIEHSQSSRDTSSPPSLLLVEGILIFNHKPLAPLFDKKYFFTLEREECWKRRRLRNYIPPDPPGYFEAAVWPYYLINKEALKDQTDIVYIPGEENQDDIFAKVLREINALL